MRVVNEPIKLGWIAGELYLEVNPDAAQSLELDETGKRPDAAAPLELPEKVKRAAGKQTARVDWTLVDTIGRRRNGIPARITR